MTVGEFLALDSCESVKHELIRGHVRTLPDVHATVTGAVYVALRHRLHGTGCRTLTSAMPMVIDDCVLRPDVFVTCDDGGEKDSCVKRSPVLVVEVMSPATAAFDRGEKFAIYRGLPSLHEYLLVAPEMRCADAICSASARMRFGCCTRPGRETKWNWPASG